MTAWFEHAVIGARGAEFSLSIVERGLIAGRALCFYLGKLIWPSQLTFIYPRWTIDASIWWQYLFPVAMLIALGVCWWLRPEDARAAGGLLIFTVTLAPALGFVNIYPFRYSFVADHFQYLASIAIITLVVAALHRALAPRTRSSRAPTRFSRSCSACRSPRSPGSRATTTSTRKRCTARPSRATRRAGWRCTTGDAEVGRQRRRSPRSDRPDRAVTGAQSRQR
jgi:hypothetical protein